MNVTSVNPCDALERPKTIPSVARGLSADEVRRLLAVVPDTVAGRRDRALLIFFVLTGRRRSEVIGLTAGDITIEGETAFYSYRGKSGKRGGASCRDPPTTRCADARRRWYLVGGNGADRYRCMACVAAVVAVLEELG